VQQNPIFHPEGDVWQHTCLVVDEAARLIREHQLPDREAEMIMLAALCHDFGKPAVTEFTDGRWKALGHETAGVEPAREFLNDLVTDNETKARVLKLVEFHMMPRKLYKPHIERGEHISDGSFRRLANKVHPATLEQLALIFEADQRGRGPFSELHQQVADILILDPDAVNGWMLERARAVEVADRRPEDVIAGKDLIALGLKPGKHFGEIIRQANDLRDFRDLSREEILERIRAGEIAASGQA
jgi:tRNA nucleotidyltransferase (CCA-adding enzyme)